MGGNYYIVEIGSTNTKAYSYYNGKVINYSFQNIEFKKNYFNYKEILNADIEKLSDFLKATFRDSSLIRIYATSIFRDLSNEQLSAFVEKLEKEVHFKSFDVVTDKTENDLTSFGAIHGFDTEDNICVFVGGGGSSEISIYNNQRIIDSSNTAFGVVDVMKEYPELASDISNISIETVDNYIEKKILLPSTSAKYLVLAGGDFLLRYRNAKYPVKRNGFFYSSNHPYVIDYNSNRQYEDVYYHNISLSNLRLTTPLTPKWWDGTRAMCAFTDVIAKHIGAEFIFPTNISMVHGIVAKLEQGEKI